MEKEKVLDSLQERKIISSLREQERFHRVKFFTIRGQRKHKALTGKMAKRGYSIQREEQKRGTVTRTSRWYPGQII